MKTITFKDTNETFNVMAEDKRYMVCSRIYTVKEREEEIEEWNKKEERYFNEAFKEAIEGTTSFIDIDTYFEDEEKHAEVRERIRDDFGEQPESLDEDAQCYTIVDLVEKIRGDDNYWNKFNYLRKDECEEALKELNSKKEVHSDIYTEYELEISRRNRVELSEYTITEMNSVESFSTKYNKTHAICTKYNYYGDMMSDEHEDSQK